MKDGKAIKVTGNKESPTYDGFCCTRGQALPEQLYHPDRLFHSQKRMPDGTYVDIPASQAMDEIAEKVGAIKEEFGPKSNIKFVNWQTQGLGRQEVSHFMK